MSDPGKDRRRPNRKAKRTEIGPGLWLDLPMRVEIANADFIGITVVLPMNSVGGLNARVLRRFAPRDLGPLGDRMDERPHHADSGAAQPVRGGHGRQDGHHA